MTKEQLAEQYAEGKSSSSVFQEAHKIDFLAGYEACEKILKKYIEFIDFEDGSHFLYRENEKLTEEEKQYLLSVYKQQTPTN